MGRAENVNKLIKLPEWRAIEEEKLDVGSLMSWEGSAYVGPLRRHCLRIMKFADAVVSGRQESKIAWHS